MTETLFSKETLPLVIKPVDKNISLAGFLDLLKDRKQDLEKKLLEHGGLLFRDFPVQNENDFGAVIGSLGLGAFMDYIGGDSPRKKIKEGIYTSTEAPPSFKIHLHNELSFVKNYPYHIYFYCDIAPKEKGETILGDAKKIFNDINPEVRDKFIQKGLRYTSNYFFKSSFMNFVNKSHKSWIYVFETEDKQEVEKKCRENEFEFQWMQDDWIKISQTRPAVLQHPVTSEWVWFNQAHHFDLNPRLLGWWRYLAVQLLYARPHMLLHEVTFADKTPIPRSDIYHILDVLDKNTLYFPWQKGDVLVLDNILAMHGRATFSGKRRILAAMTN